MLLDKIDHQRKKMHTILFVFVLPVTSACTLDRPKFIQNRIKNPWMCRQVCAFDVYMQQNMLLSQKMKKGIPKCVFSMALATLRVKL